MKSYAVFAVGMLSVFAANATESCAVQSARLLSQARVADLAKMFTTPGDKLTASLEQVAAVVGPVKQILPLKYQPAGQVIRQTVAIDGLPVSYQFVGSWALFVTKNGERYQLQASSESGTACKLLALHLDQAAK